MRLTAFAAAMVISVLPQAQPLDVVSLLDRYESGRFDDAVRPVANATEDQVRVLRAHLKSAGRVWIDAPGHSPSSRMAVAAMFALEVEAARAERGEWAPPNDYFCAGACMIEWGCALFHERAAIAPDAPQAPDPLEHEWFAASLTLASGVRDWTFLHLPRLTAEPFGEAKGHADHALARFPGDVPFRLTRAQSVAFRFEATTEQSVPHEGTRLGFPAAPVPTITVNGVTIGQPSSSAANRRSAQRQATFKELADLSADAVLGAHARARLAYLRWANGEYEEAMSEAVAAAGLAANPDDRYLAWYVAGLAAQSSGALAKAESSFASALEARPNSQAASVALAALRFQRGDAAGAYAISQDSLVKKKTDDDPWRLFQYGDYPKMPVRIQAMRNAFTASRTK